MALLSVHYELHEASPRARSLEHALVSIGARRLLAGTWVIETSVVPEMIVRRLIPMLVPKDRLVVFTITVPAAWLNLELAGLEGLHGMLGRSQEPDGGR